MTSEALEPYANLWLLPILLLCLLFPLSLSLSTSLPLTTVHYIATSLSSISVMCCVSSAASLSVSLFTLLSLRTTRPYSVGFYLKSFPLTCSFVFVESGWPGWGSKSAFSIKIRSPCSLGKDGRNSEIWDGICAFVSFSLLRERRKEEGKHAKIVNALFFSMYDVRSAFASNMSNFTFIYSLLNVSWRVSYFGIEFNCLQL